MNRRAAVRNIIIISAGASLLPGCTSTEESSLHFKNIPLTRSQEEMLAELTETIIPGTNNFIGAKDIKTNEHVLVMVDDCASPDDQKAFINGMKSFEDACKKKFDTKFAKCTPQQRIELLKEMEASKDEKDEAAKFYKAIKRLTIQNFTTSKDYLTNVVKWKLVPGSNFKGCVPV